MFKRTIFLILCLIFSNEASAEDSCRLIGRIDIDSDLWVVDKTGKIIQRLTHDGVYKTAAAWSPDGKYIAYAPAPFSNFDEKAIVIVDNIGNEISKIIVEPKTDDPEHQYIRWISRLVWEKPNILWSDSAVGRNSGFIDIWQLDHSFRSSHKKRIAVWGGGCELSLNKQYVACVDAVFENEKFLFFLNIYDTSKKRFPEDKFFSDVNPRKVDLKHIGRINKSLFTPDSKGVIIIGEDKKYMYNMKTSELSEIEELPPDVKIKTIPERLKVKKG